MIFQHTWEKIISGEKTQTRRITKLGDVELVKPLDTDLVVSQGEKLFVFYKPNETREATSVERNGRHLYYIGQTHAVQPGRGKKQVARIRLTGIRLEDVREISDEDVKAEGFGCDKDAFLETWCLMHDPDILPFYTAMYRQGWLTDRPAERYQAWALTFEVVK